MLHASQPVQCESYSPSDKGTVQYRQCLVLFRQLHPHAAMQNQEYQGNYCIGFKYGRKVVLSVLRTKVFII